ncbi:MAG: hypothetical protein ACKO2P_10500 [Planctomycetota bacterium]
MQGPDTRSGARSRLAGPGWGFQQAAASSGVVFAALYATSLALLRIAVPADPRDPGEWLADPTRCSQVHMALNLVPFTGIAFLWFMALIDVRLQLAQNRIAATVFLGSGLLFVAMLFSSAAGAQGLLNAFAQELLQRSENDAWKVSRGTVYALMNPFAIRMAAVFTFVTSSAGLRSGLLHRWVAMAGFPCGAVLLLIITDFAWVALLFPCWVLLVTISFPDSRTA